ncbi:MAG: AmmeMemoRadiSam system protein B, partial [Desulfovibrionales bacterium]
MDRDPVVAGQFYPGSRNQWEPMVRRYLQSGTPSAEHSILSMAPHAGYVYSGGIAGKTIKTANPAPTVVMLGPNHTGRGASLALWARGVWNVPGAGLEIHEGLADTLLQEEMGVVEDYEAHLFEHSLEVMVPFLWAMDPQTRIVPISVSEHDPDTLIQVGERLARVIDEHSGSVSILVSSDMSHYVSHDQAKSQDSEALNKILDLDPRGLHETVRRQNISMCGALPMTLGLAAALKLGAGKAELVGYTTSGEVSGDYAQVVGYAGVVVR